jgi:hypothetical protein
MNARDCYLLGAAVASFDPSTRTLTAGCIDNITNNPKLAPVFLRHVWRKMHQHERCRELLVRIDFAGDAPNVATAGGFWIGFYQERSGEALRQVNPESWEALHPSEAVASA